MTNQRVSPMGAQQIYATVQRIDATILIGIQAIALGYFTKQLFFPLVMVSACFASMLLKWRFEIDRRSGFWSCIALFFFFCVKYLIVPHEFDSSTLFIRTQFAYALGQFFLTLQVSQFYVRRPHDRLPIALPALGIVTMVFLGDVRPDAKGLLAFQLLSIGFVLCVAMYGLRILESFRQKKVPKTWGRAVFLLLLFAMIGGTGWGMASFLRQHERDFDSIIQRYLILRQPLGRTGFSGKARLGSVAHQKTTGSQQIALQVFAEDAPGYLRGKTFDSYQSGQWSQTGDQRTLTPAIKPPAGIKAPQSGNRTFVASRQDSSNWRELEVLPHATQLPAFFSPLGTTVLQAPLLTVPIDDDAVFSAQDLEQGTTFHVAVPESSDVSPLSAEDRKRLTSIPFNLDPRISEMAKATLGKLPTTVEKIAAVEAYFAENYEYQLGITVPREVDPLNYFLLEQPPAHCEYFAAGATVLLRLSGVPCRYVTGFVAVEENSYGDYWIARNKDAHAWVEAYDEQRGWVTVEATPASGVPEAQKTAQSKQLWEYLRDSFKALISQLRRGDIRGFVVSILQLAVSVPGLICLVMLFGYLSRHRLKQWRITRSVRKVEDPLIVELRRLLKKMDARMSKQQLQRHPGETLHHFAHRISETAESETQTTAAIWYRNYATLRYGGELSRAGVEQLAKEFEGFRRG